MNRQLLRVRMVLTMDPARRVVDEGGILIHNSTIERILTPADLAQFNSADATVIHEPTLVAIPGFIQTHIHLCQTLFRGLAEDRSLLDWLRGRIFPLEAAHTAESMYASARIGLIELIRSGTTTIMDMGSVHHEDEVVRAVEESGIRAFVGKAMMDVNELFPPLCETTEEALKSTRRQAERWHGSSSGRIRYAVAPRFVLSCSDTLLTEAYAMTRDFPGMLFHTHASENRREMDAVRARCGMDNVEFFSALGILHHNTCLAHCVWLNDNELDLLERTGAKVLHCPSSNLKLGSGVARIPAMRSRGITVSLAADGAPCNNSLDMFQEMRLAALMQKVQHGSEAMPGRDVVAMATIDGARALGIEAEVGSLEAGKKADIVLLDVNRVWNPLRALEHDTVYGTIVHSCRPENVRSVMIDGQWVYREGAWSTLSEDRSLEDARRALHTLLQRVQLT